jgi:hypothetical protein
LNLKSLSKAKYSHVLAFLYLLIYFPWFFALENYIVEDYTQIHIWLDDYIPFCEAFIIPYCLWYFFMIATMLFLFFTSRKDFLRYCALMFGGMTICLTIFTIWPNGQNLRPDLNTIDRDNIFMDAVRYLYSIDTCTNVLPSIHVYNSLATHTAIINSEKLSNHKWIRIGSFVLTILICLSTVCLKQHSAADGLAAIVLISILYPLIYTKDTKDCRQFE